VVYHSMGQEDPGIEGPEGKLYLSSGSMREKEQAILKLNRKGDKYRGEKRNPGIPEAEER